MVNEDKILDSVEHNIKIHFEDSNQAKIIYDSVLLEFETSPDYRSTMDLKLDNNIIIIYIKASDATSYRASINSSIKWIKLALEVNNLV